MLEVSDLLAVKVENISVSYKVKNNKNFYACKNISFFIKKGEVVGLLGESGCGKSTVAKAMLGLIKVETGKISIFEKKPQMIFQDPANSLNPSMKVARIIEEPLKIVGGMTRFERRSIVEKMAEDVELDKVLLNRFLNALSGGQRQRVSIAVALMGGTKFLVADEPVSSLDVTIQAQILQLLEKIKKKQRLSMLFISHDLRIIYSMCDRVLVMKDGVIVEEGKTKEVFDNPKTEYMKSLLNAVE